MFSLLRRHRPTPALIIAIVALIMAMGGAAYAATQLPPNSVGTVQLKNGAVTNPKLAAGSVANANLNPDLQNQLAARNKFESSRFCTPTLCIDADPASGGSGGWGYNNGNVTNLTKGQTYPFTVTVVQDGSQTANGSITLTWNPTDFSGPTTSGDPSATCATASTGNAVSCTYTDLAHQYKSDAFNFKALADNPSAQVEVTVEVNGEEASAQFPVAITG